MDLRVTIWNEFRQEREVGTIPARLYPEGIHAAIASGVTALDPNIRVRLATLDDPEHGLTEALLDDTDVLLWWGHIAHSAVDDAVVTRVHDRVLGGMGLVMLHSAHYSKIFRRLMGTTCSLGWRSADDRELVWCVAPSHPIAAGVPNPIVIPGQEMYAEPFDIPTPDDLVFISSFTGGEVFRSGGVWHRGHGRVFYFSPGDQDFPVYHQPEVHRVLANGIRYVAPTLRTAPPPAPNRPRDWYLAAGA